MQPSIPEAAPVGLVDWAPDVSGVFEAGDTAYLRETAMSLYTMVGIRKRFNPLPDITAYELAVIVSNSAPFGGEPIGVKGISFTQEVWDKTPENIRRHFVDMKDDAA